MAARIGIGVCTPWPHVKGTNGRPILEPMTPLWHRRRYGISFPTNCNVVEYFVDGLGVAEARNSVARKIAESDNPPEFLFFLDYDVIPPFDCVTKLFTRARHFPDYDVFAGVYTPKWMNPCEPIIYAGDGRGPFWDWTIGDLLTTDKHGITGTHMGCTLIRTSLFQRLLPWDDKRPWFKTTNERRIADGVMISRRGTEDLYFYNEARKRLGECKILIDTSVLCEHHDKNTGIGYGLPPDCGPVERARWLPRVQRLPDGSPSLEPNSSPDHDEKKVLDLGAGPTRRFWQGYKTYTTDLRTDVEADYCMDTRCLNLPDNHFDMVASSHHLEHIPRWEQEQAWAEIFRVCKPGGTIEHVVPTWDWAAYKLVDGQADVNVLNVLVGAQEAHGYDRLLNTHFMPYTKIIARALAEKAGFVDVRCEDWRDHPEFGYNLRITGRKPEPEPEIAALPENAVSGQPANRDGYKAENGPQLVCRDNVMVAKED